MNKKFYLCNICKNLVDLINDGGGTLVCCGEEMELLINNTVDADYEKHIPAIDVKHENNRKVLEIKIGDVIHPMEENHYIDFIYIEYINGGTLIKLDITKDPILTWDITDENVLAVYAYCNLHGMWAKNLED